MAPGTPLVTLTTDIGWAYAAQMKAVLYRALPTVRVVDLAHDLAPHRVGEAAFLLRHMAAGFPAGTVHVAVVDPGVGSARAAVAVACSDGSRLVGPDNGVLSPLAAHLGLRRCVRLSRERVAPGARGSATFDGRDLFAPAAARLAGGAPLDELGTPFDLEAKPIPTAVHRHGGVDGTVLHVDRFGNLITNVEPGALPPGVRRVVVRFGRGRPRILPFVRTYSDLAPGRLGLLNSSFGLLEVAAREASAADRCHAGPGDPLRLEGFGAPTPPARDKN